MFTFNIENHEPFGILTKNCPKLDKNKTTESRFSVFVPTNQQLVPFQKATVGNVSISSVNVCICTSF